MKKIKKNATLCLVFALAVSVLSFSGSALDNEISISKTPFIIESEKAIVDGNELTIDTFVVNGIKVTGVKGETSDLYMDSALSQKISTFIENEKDTSISIMAASNQLNYLITASSSQDSNVVVAQAASLYRNENYNTMRETGYGYVIGKLNNGLPNSIKIDETVTFSSIAFTPNISWPPSFSITNSNKTGSWTTGNVSGYNLIKGEREQFSAQGASGVSISSSARIQIGSLSRVASVSRNTSYSSCFYE